MAWLLGGAAVAAVESVAASLLPPQEVSATTCFSGAPPGDTRRVSFVRIDTEALRSATDGSPDFALEHLAGTPETSELHATSADADAIELLRQLRALSRRPALNVSDAVVVGKLGTEYGAGSTIHSLVYPVLEALVDGRTLFAPPLTIWAPKACTASDLSCYFDSLPSLADYTLDGTTGIIVRRAAASGEAAEGEAAAVARPRATPAAAATVLLDANGLNDAAPVDTTWMRIEDAHKADSALERQLRASCAAGRGCAHSVDLNFTYFSTVDELALYARLSDRFTRHGRFWLISQVLHFITRPNTELARRLDSARAKLDLRPPSLALHIRKGDACTHRGDCRDLQWYMPRIERLVARYGLRSILLSTPSEDVQRATASYPHLHFSYLPVTSTAASLKAHNLSRIEEGLGLGVVDAGEEFRSFMLDIYLLASGSVFLGGFTSNAARLAFSLMRAGDEGCLKPYESTDINWCFAFGKGGHGVIRLNAQPCSDDLTCSQGC